MNIDAYSFPVVVMKAYSRQEKVFTLQNCKQMPGKNPKDFFCFSTEKFNCSQWLLQSISMTKE